MKFEKGKRYIFSKDKWLADTRNVWIYESYQPIREWVNKSDGQEVKNISADGIFGYVEKHAVAPYSCDIIKPYLCQVFGQAVKRLMHEDREDKILERINMIQEEIDETEMHISILRDEQDNLLEELEFIQERSR